jgi:peptidoglycan/xylan/chitin deacetylase (PgdA/CDA1 family)/GT2 family glycosyltransferase
VTEPINHGGAAVSSPRLSVVTATRSGSVRLPQLIESLALQDIVDPWEWVVVLDGVTDQTPAVLDVAAERLPLRVLRLDSAHGVAGALSVGYAAAQGQVVLRCDDDLTLPPFLLSGHLAHHTRRGSGAPPLGVISMTRDEFAPSPYARAYGLVANERLLSSAYARPPADRWRHWAACNSVSLAAYDAVGGFDTTLAYREDSDLGYRLAASGVEILIDPVLEVGHRAPATRAAERAERAYLSGSTVSAFEARHPGATTPTGGAGRTAWSTATNGAARLIRSPRTARASGRMVDVLLPATPGRAGRLLTAMAVEASGLAGATGVHDVTWDRRPRTLGPHPLDRAAARLLPRFPGHRRPAPSIVGVETPRPEFVLTFDDGPTPGTTESILEVLRDHGATATFFVLANRAVQHPSLMRDVLAEGHEIGLHGPDHRRLTLFSARQVRDRTRAARQTVEDLAGTPVRWFRPPYGAQGIRAWVGIRQAGLSSVLWSATFDDWRDLDPDERLRLAVDATTRGGIVLGHDGFAGPWDGVDDGPEPSLDRAAFLLRYLESTRSRGLRALSLGGALTDGATPVQATWLRAARSVTSPHESA